MNGVDDSGTPLDMAWKRVAQAFLTSMRAHVAADGGFADLIIDEAEALGLEPNDIASTVHLRVLSGDRWDREWAQRLYPEIEVSDEWLAAVDRVRDAHLRWVGVS